jgi:hypothetical protein
MEGKAWKIELIMKYKWVGKLLKKYKKGSKVKIITKR